MTTVFLKSDVAAYTWDGTTLTTIIDADYPATTVPGVAWINGRIVVMEPDGTISHSDEDDFTSWNALNFVTAQVEPDGGVFLGRNSEYVVAMGTYTIEFFWDASNATGSILSNVPNTVMMVGCVHAGSVQQVESGMIWCAQQRGLGGSTMLGRFVAVLKNTTYERVSTPDIDKILTNSTMTNVGSGVVTIAGHEFYVLTLRDEDLTLAYDLREGTWAQWTLGTAGTTLTLTSPGFQVTQTGGMATANSTAHGKSDGDPITTSGSGVAGYNVTANITVVDANTIKFPVAANTAASATGLVVAAHWTYGKFDIAGACKLGDQQLVQLRLDGSVNYIDLSNISDLGAPIDALIRTPIFDGGTYKEKVQSDLTIVGNQVSSTALIRWSDDDYRTFNNYKRVDMNVQRPHTTRGGNFKKRSYDVRHALLDGAVMFNELDVEIKGK